MKILRTVGILALVAGLLLGGGGTAFAEKPPDVPRGGGPHSPGKRGLSGNVTSVETITAGEEYVIELETKQWGTVHVTANVTAKYMVPRETKGPKDLATFLEIVGDPPAIEGRRLAVLVTNFVEGGYVPITADAIRLMLIPSPDSPPSWVHRVGVVDTFTPYDPGPPAADGEILILDKDGVSHTFTINEDTVYRPDTIAGLTGTDLELAITGGFVTVVTKGDPQADPPPVAKAIVLHKPEE